MKPKHLLTIFMLLFVGAISAFSLTSNLPESSASGGVGEETGDKPTQTILDITKLDSLYTTINDSINNGHYKEFYASVTNTDIYKAAGDTLKNTGHTATQDFINKMVLQLESEQRKAPFNYANANYQTKYVEYYGEWNENDATYKKVFNESDFGSLKMMIDSISTLYANKENEIPENEIYGEEDKKETIQIVDKVEINGKDTTIIYKNVEVIIPGKRGIIRHYNECVTNRATSFTYKKKALNILIDSISANYLDLKNKNSYKIPAEWYCTNSSFTYSDHAITDIILYIDYLNNEISFAIFRTTCNDIMEESAKSIKQYFLQEEQIETNESWKAVYQPYSVLQAALQQMAIEPEKNKFNFNNKTYSSLSEMKSAINIMQQDIQKQIQTLQESLDEEQETLRKLIDKANLLLSSLVKGVELNNNLNQNIKEAQIQNSGTTVLSKVKNAITALNQAYTAAAEYYNELKMLLEAEIQKAEKITNHSSFQQEINDAKKLLNENSTDTQIINATKTLTNKIEIAAKKQVLTRTIENLENCKSVYGDKDNSIATLLNEAKAAKDEEIEILTDKIKKKIKAVETTYTEVSDSLQNLIDASLKFSEENKGEEGIDKLEEQIASAKAVKESTKIIISIRKAYSELNKVYMEVGGDAEAFISRRELEKTLTEATECYKKYRYSDLLTLINTAKGYINSDIKYLLDQQTQALKKGIITTKEQYELIIARLDEQIITTKAKVEERYVNDIPTNYQTILTTVADSLQVKENERACTNVSQLQKYYLSLQNIITESDDTWSSAVADLLAAIQDADLKYQTDYSDKEELGAAISTANNKYENIANYPAIASVKGIAKELDKVLSNIESPLRRNLAKLFSDKYASIRDTLQIYGPDDNSLNSSNARQYIIDKSSLYDELSVSTATISYSLTQLEIFSDSAQLVQSTYSLFCNASINLGKTIKEAQHLNEKYYNNENEDTGLYKAIQNATEAKEHSYSKETIEDNNVALKDSMRVTALIYNNTLRNMKIARNTAYLKNTIYLGSETTESDILTVYNESEALLKDSLIRKLEEMTIRLDECYKPTEAACALKEEEINELIDLSEPVNLLMEDETFDNEIAEAINAQYSNDGRISAIDEHLVLLQKMYNEQLQKYTTARSALDTKIIEAEQLFEKRADKNLSDTITLTKLVLERAQDMTAENASKYTELTHAQEWLKTVMEKVYSQIGNELTDARNELAKAREQALAKHNLFYGVENTDSMEILTVYRNAEPYLTSDNLADIIIMTDSVNKSYTRSAVECSQKEATLDNLIRKSTPLVTLMDNEELAAIIIAARECRNRMDGRIVAIDSVRPSLQTAYEADCLKYDEAKELLNDSIVMAKTLLEIKKDEDLQNAVIASEALLQAADKTSAASAKYTELKMQSVTLNQDMERVRKLIAEMETGIYSPEAEDREVEIYTTQGFLVKRAKPSDDGSFRNLPEGVYIVDGKKIYIHAK